MKVLPLEFHFKSCTASLCMKLSLLWMKERWPAGQRCDDKMEEEMNAATTISLTHSVSIHASLRGSQSLMGCCELRLPLARRPMKTMERKHQGNFGASSDDWKILHAQPVDSPTAWPPYLSWDAKPRSGHRRRGLVIFARFAWCKNPPQRCCRHPMPCKT